MFLTSTTDKIQVKTGSTANTDIYVTYYDRGAGPMVMARWSGTIATVGVTDVVASPAQDVIRIVKSASVTNRHASAQQNVTIIHTDGTTTVNIREVVLNAGDTLQYDERNGWSVMQKTLAVSTSAQPMVNQLTEVVLPSDVVNSNAVANTIADVTGLTFPVAAGGTYKFWIEGFYDAAATTTGSRWSITGPAFTKLCYNSEYSLAAGTTTRNVSLQAYDMPAASNTSSTATSGNGFWLWGIIKPSANGNVTVRFASEITASAITAKAGASLRWIRTA